MVLQSEDGAEVDLRPVFKMGSCAALFGACFERLMVRLIEGGGDDDDGLSSSLPSCLGLMIDGARLKAERGICEKTPHVLQKFEEIVTVMYHFSIFTYMRASEEKIKKGSDDLCIICYDGFGLREHSNCIVCQFSIFTHVYGNIRRSN